MQGVKLEYIKITALEYNTIIFTILLLYYYKQYEDTICTILIHIYPPSNVCL